MAGELSIEEQIKEVLANDNAFLEQVKLTLLGVNEMYNIFKSLNESFNNIESNFLSHDESLKNLQDNLNQNLENMSAQISNFESLINQKEKDFQNLQNLLNETSVLMEEKGEEFIKISDEVNNLKNIILEHKNEIAALLELLRDTENYEKLKVISNNFDAQILSINSLIENFNSNYLLKKIDFKHFVQENKKSLIKDVQISNVKQLANIYNYLFTLENTIFKNTLKQIKE
ncbi:hypothetical protein [Campylobacter sp. LR286c]|uniref:hypothetical protein n=1 Tax=Campylobacter sp. LR286c TaxID=2593545 RepID=UPI001237B330|nr:hypothetical protein [Campylobacter sp. LR286c]KAA6228568.1 hypothetical protein FMM57_03125 [Campylobacter sp. LR286c]